MQASRSWAPPTGTLGEILDATRRRLPSIEGRVSGGTQAAAGRKSFQGALRRETVAVIAELKRRSPSQGSLNEHLDPRMSIDFERGGAAAISVLTEPTYFGGSLQDLSAVRSAVSLPILRKDFHIEVAQLREARAAGATAALLIARALSPDDLPRMMDEARALGLETLVEVRSEPELERAIDAGAEIIGVNSRDLETLQVDERVPERLIPAIPSHVIAVWESGVHETADVRRAADAGADAVLVGSALSRSADAVRLLRELSSVARKSRAR